MTDIRKVQGTVDVLRTELDGLDRLLHARFEAHTHETRLALDALERRIENIYAALDRIRDSLNTTLPRDVYDDRHELIESRLANLEQSRSRNLGILVGVSTATTLLLGAVVTIAIRLFG